ncbi:MAG: DUF2752 domain-containing protein [Bacteroidaceae bacterium]|nr:DUF2752 domain-containing protein [Bacteroidaceae bacterium]
MPYVFPMFVLGVLVLYCLVDPLQSHFPIQCPWHLLTGTQCPGCGFQRALFALLHGQWYGALRYNYFFVFSLPYALMAILATWYNYHHIFDSLRTFVYHRVTMRVYVVLFFAWWVIRNVFDL